MFLTGAPATGKTTLLNKLPHDIGFGYIAKDDIKELLFDTLGAPADKQESRVYGKAVIDSLFLITTQLAMYGKSFIVEAAFMPKFANKDLAQFKSLSCKILQIYCHVPHEVRYERMRNRTLSGQRHSAHSDPIGISLDEHIKQGEEYGPLDIESTIHIDMSDFTQSDYKKLLEWIEKESR